MMLNTPTHMMIRRNWTNLSLMHLGTLRTKMHPFGGRIDKNRLGVGNQRLNAGHALSRPNWRVGQCAASSRDGQKRNFKEGIMVDPAKVAMV